MLDDATALDQAVDRHDNGGALYPRYLPACTTIVNRLF